jgi:hypothetical protein
LEQTIDEPKQKAQDAAPMPEVKYYNFVKWAANLFTFQCATCNHCDEDQDNMIMHVILHAPENEREPLFEKLVRSKL